MKNRIKGYQVEFFCNQCAIDVVDEKFFQIQADAQGYAEHNYCKIHSWCPDPHQCCCQESCCKYYRIKEIEEFDPIKEKRKDIDQEINLLDSESKRLSHALENIKIAIDNVKVLLKHEKAGENYLKLEEMYKEFEGSAKKISMKIYEKRKELCELDNKIGKSN